MPMRLLGRLNAITTSNEIEAEADERRSRTCHPLLAAAVAWIGCLLAVVGTLGLWVKALGASVSGLDYGNDGWIVLVLALTSAAFTLGAAIGRNGCANFFMCSLALAAAAGIVAIGLSDLHDLTTKIEATGVQGLVSLGCGLNVVIAAGFVIGIGAITVSFLRERPRFGSAPQSGSAA
jgi:hypothetical protein